MISAQHITAALMVNPVLTVVLIVLFVAVMIGLNSRGRETASRRRHRRHQATATRVLARLPLLGGDGQRLAYLRKINPYVFEELLLLAFERQGYAVIRNTSYSGDGGLDGQVIIEGKTYLIQAKRYGRTITPSHITSFGALLRDHHC
ncbi:TPA: restriction endonuclease, partial [Serratia marcescens]